MGVAGTSAVWVWLVPLQCGCGWYLCSVDVADISAVWAWLVLMWLCVLGDLIWILTQSQLRAVSRLVQSLMDAAVRTQQEKRGSVAGDDDSDSESVDSFESISNERSRPNKTSSGSKNKKVSRSSQRYSKIFQERVKAYMEGRKNLPSHEVIQNSFHLKTGKVDLQLCDDTASSGVEGSLLIQVVITVITGNHSHHW